MSRRTTSPHPAQQPARGRVGWMVAGGLVLAGMATYAVVLHLAKNPGAANGADAAGRADAPGRGFAATVPNAAPAASTGT